MSATGTVLPPIRPAIAVIMGVTGTGKSTVAALLVTDLGWPMAEGDDFHSEANKQKMHSGHPLTDEDRWPWLRAIAAWIHGAEQAGTGAIVTCSALKRSYRDVLREGNRDVRFICLVGTRELLAQRLAGRHGHFMDPALLDSQLDTLEPLGPDEPGATIDVAAPIAQIEAEALAVLRAPGQISADGLPEQVSDPIGDAG